MKRTVKNMPLHTASALVAAVLMTIGCGDGASQQGGEPSHADLVLEYNSELEYLNRLEGQREQLIEKHTAQLQSSDAARVLGEVLDVAKNMDKRADPNEVVDPDTALDRAVENAEKIQEVTSKLLDSVAGDGEAATSDDPQADAKLKRELDALDRDIADQKARVARAKEARDDAEAGDQ